MLACTPRQPHNRHPVAGQSSAYPKIPSPSPKITDHNLIFAHHQKLEPPNSNGCGNRPDLSGPARCAYGDRLRDRGEPGPLPEFLSFPKSGNNALWRSDKGITLVRGGGGGGGGGGVQ